MVEMILPILYLFENVGPSFCLEWEVAAHEHIEEHTHGPAVDLAVIMSLLSILDLRRHIIWGTCDGFKFLARLLSF